MLEASFLVGTVNTKGGKALFRVVGFKHDMSGGFQVGSVQNYQVIKGFGEAIGNPSLSSNLMKCNTSFQDRDVLLWILYRLLICATLTPSSCVRNKSIRSIPVHRPAPTPTTPLVKWKMCEHELNRQDPSTPHVKERLHPQQLTWQWNTTIIYRKYIFRWAITGACLLSY